MFGEEEASRREGAGDTDGAPKLQQWHVGSIGELYAVDVLHDHADGLYVDPGRLRAAEAIVAAGWTRRREECGGTCRMCRAHFGEPGDDA